MRAKQAVGDAAADLPAAVARCLCGAVRLEVVLPAFWAWHDHSRATQRAHGAAYATFVGTWRSRMRIVAGAEQLGCFADPATNGVRHFCRSCGTHVLYERTPGARMVNIPRALFEGRTGREPRYHIAFAESPEWAYRGEALGPLKNYPGVLWTGARRRAGKPPDEAWPEPPP